MAKVKQAVSLFRRRASLEARQTNSLPYIQSESAISQLLHKVGQNSTNC
jgi:hypothetical protein